MEMEDGEAPAWYAFDDGATIGQPGSEGGVIVRDDEHPWGARITLERGAGPALFAITCGMYGWMVHTRFFHAAGTAEREFAAMRDALAAILELAPRVDDPEVDEKMHRVSDAIQRFIDRFP